MLQPNVEWQWITEGQYLALELGQTMCFQTPYTMDSLYKGLDSSSSFTLEQHEIYSNIANALSEYDNGSGAQKTQVAINALALICFGKAIAAKSWFFDSSPENEKLARYQSAFLKIDEVAFEVMILAFDRDCAYCMLLANEMIFGSQKVIRQFFPVKVMTNRLFSSSE